MGKTALHPLPLDREQRRGAGGALLAPAAQGAGAAGVRGKRRRAARATYSQPWLGLGRSEEIGPRRRAVSSRGNHGGGAAGGSGGRSLQIAMGGIPFGTVGVR